MAKAKVKIKPKPKPKPKKRKKPVPIIPDPKPAAKPLVEIPKPPVINKPVEAPKVSKPVEPEKGMCKLTGLNTKGLGYILFNADQPPHQNHSVDFTCQNVYQMEQQYGRHSENCSHTGYWSSTKCGCVKK